MVFLVVEVVVVVVVVVVVGGSFGLGVGCYRYPPPSLMVKMRDEGQ